MKARKSILYASITMILLAAILLAGELATAQSNGTTERVSVASDGTQGNSTSSDPSTSADGRYIAFVSLASNLVDNDTNYNYDVFVHDRQMGRTDRVSIASDGTEGEAGAFSPSISTDGRYVAFDSWSSNLVTGDTNFRYDVFVHDRQTELTARVSIASDGTQGNEMSRNPSISADGRYVAFWSSSSNLVGVDTNDLPDVFVHDRQTGQTNRVSIASDGTQGNGVSQNPSISVNGRYVAFQSGANNLVNNDTNGEQDVFVHDRDADEDGIFDEAGQVNTALVSIASDGTQGNGGAGYPSISGNGRYVAFDSWASNLVSGNTNDILDIFVHDRQAGQTNSISIASDGTQGNNNSFDPSISDDGRYVAFFSYASNLISNDTNGTTDAFVHDRDADKDGIFDEAGQVNTALVSIASDGTQGNGGAGYLSISGNGRYIAFESSATNLISDDTNGNADIFVHDRGEVVSSYSISGWVTDVDNNPVSGVTILVSSGDSISTDANGNYTITGLDVGTYIITPTKNSGYYTYSPLTRTVTLPPSETEQNFTDVTDSDGDGLYDYWEANGRNGLDLPAMGANSNHKDIFVEVDYMEECTPVFPGVCYIHSHRPNPDAIALVVESFKNAPVGNPDGIGGINLHVDFGPDTPMKPDGTEWGELSDSNPLQHTDFLNETIFNALKQDNFAPVRDGVFHYVIFAHFLGDVPPCTSGRSWGIPSFDFVVSLGGWGGALILPIEPYPCFAPVRQNSTGTLWQQAGTFMHELGHNLGLRHGGGDNINRKPNYLSIMNYDFQMDGLIYDNHQGGYFNFSRSDQIPPLDETSLDEAGGLNGGSSSVQYGTKWRCPNGTERTTTSANSPINWNCDGDEIDSGINVDINNDDLCVERGGNDILDTPPAGDDVVDNNDIHNGPNGRCDSTAVSDDIQLSTLVGFDDWAKLVYDGGRSVNGAGSTLPIELTIDQDDQLLHPYRIGLFGPAGAIVSADSTTVYTLTMANIGDNDDTYALTATSSLGWVDVASVPNTLSLSSGATREITVSVTVPPSASATDVDVLRIAATSSNNAALWTSHYIRTSVKSSTTIYLPIILK